MHHFQPHHSGDPADHRTTRHPTLTPSAIANAIWEQGYRHVFGVHPPAKRFALGFNELLGMHNLTTKAIISPAGPQFEKSIDAALKSSDRLGLKVVLRETFQDDRRFEPLAQAAKESGAQVLQLVGYFDDTVNMRRLE